MRYVRVLGFVGGEVSSAMGVGGGKPGGVCRGQRTIFEAEVIALRWSLEAPHTLALNDVRLDSGGSRRLASALTT
jgi:hypothetical protein